MVAADDPQEIAQILEFDEVLGRIVVGVPGVHERDGEVGTGLLRVPNDDQLTNFLSVSLKVALDPYELAEGEKDAPYASRLGVRRTRADPRSSSGGGPTDARRDGRRP